MHCDKNPITSLEPITIRNLSLLDCSNTRITSFGKALLYPPRVFRFYNTAVSDSVLEYAARYWERDQSTHRYAMQARILLALRHGRYSALRGLGRRLGDHTYTVVPKLTTFEEAREMARLAGGHLLRIETAKELREFRQAFYWIDRSWLDMTLTDSGPVWGDGIPVTTGRALDHLGSIVPDNPHAYLVYGTLLRNKVATACPAIEFDDQQAAYAKQ